jgi:hypothetical protein
MFSLCVTSTATSCTTPRWVPYPWAASLPTTPDVPIHGHIPVYGHIVASPCLAPRLRRPLPPRPALLPGVLATRSPLPHLTPVWHGGAVAGGVHAHRRDRHDQPGRAPQPKPSPDDSARHLARLPSLVPTLHRPTGRWPLTPISPRSSGSSLCVAASTPSSRRHLSSRQPRSYASHSYCSAEHGRAFSLNRPVWPGA